MVIRRAHTHAARGGPLCRTRRRAGRGISATSDPTLGRFFPSRSFAAGIFLAAENFDEALFAVFLAAGFFDAAPSSRAASFVAMLALSAAMRSTTARLGAAGTHSIVSP